MSGKNCDSCKRVELSLMCPDDSSHIKARSCQHSLCSSCAVGKCAVCGLTGSRQIRYFGSLTCEACGDSYSADAFLWCTDHCRRLLCNFCFTVHCTPSPFHELGAVSAVKRRLECKNFQEQMKLRCFMVKVADELWKGQENLVQSLDEAYPLQTGMESELYPDLGTSRATLLAKDFLSAAGKEVKAEESVLSRLESLGVSHLADAITSALDLLQAASVRQGTGDKAEASSVDLGSCQSGAGLGASGIKDDRPAEKMQKAPVPAKAPATKPKPAPPVPTTKRAPPPPPPLISKPIPTAQQVLSASFVSRAPPPPPVKLPGTTVTTSVEMMVDGAWKRGPELVEGRARATGAVLAGHLVLVGGLDPAGNRTSKALLLDIRAKDPAWKLVSGPPMNMSHAAAVTVGSQIFLVGGVTNNQGKKQGKKLQYKPTANTLTLQADQLKKNVPVWRGGPKLTYARAGHGLVAIGNVIYAIGGYGDGTVSDEFVGRSIEKLDTTKRKWELLKDQLREKAVNAAIVSLQ